MRIGRKDLAKPLSNLPPLHAGLLPRDDLTASLRSTLATHRIVALVSDRAGSGKTLAAVQYAAAFACDYPGGCFILPWTAGGVMPSLAAIAPNTGGARFIKDDARAAAMLDALRRGPACLVIVDALPDEAAWQACPLNDAAASLIHVLITSGASSLGGVPSVALPPMPAGGPWPEAFIHDPAALDAARVILGRTPSLTASELASRLSRVADPIDAVFSLLSDALEGAERWLLDTATVMPPGWIARRWLAEMLVRRTGLRPKPGAPVSAEDAQPIDRLIELGVLRPTTARGNVLALPSSLRAWRNRRIEQQPALEKTLGNAVLAFLKDRHAALADWKSNRILLDEFDALCAMADYLGHNGAPQSAIVLGNALHGAMLALRRHEQYVLTLQPLLARLPAPPTGVAAARFADALGNVAGALRSLKRFDEAAAALDKAIGVERHAHGEQTHRMGWLLHRKALALSDLGQSAPAEALMWQAMAIHRLHMASDDKRFWAHHTVLSVILKAQGKFAAAAEQAERALAISQGAGRTEAEVAGDYSLLAVYHRKAGDVQKALDARLKCVELSERALPEKDPQQADRFFLLATDFKALGRWTEARSWLERAVAARQAALPDDPRVATFLFSLASVQRRLNDPRGAVDSLARALEIRRKREPADEPSLAMLYHNLFAAHKASGNLPAARQCHRAASACMRRLPSNHRMRLAIEKARRRAKLERGADPEESDVT